jgi:hypothetical protein
MVVFFGVVVGALPVVDTSDDDCLIAIVPRLIV